MKKQYKCRIFYAVRGKSPGMIDGVIELSERGSLFVILLVCDIKRGHFPDLFVYWSEMEKQELMVRSSVLSRTRLLVIDPEYMEFDDQDRVSEAPTRFRRADIEGLRYGVKSIRGYRFRIGRIYCIDIRDVSGHIIKIRLKSLYRVRLKLLEQKYLEIVNALFRYYFHKMIWGYVEQFRDGQPVELLGVSLNREGVLFDEKVGRISWDFLGTRRYWHYYTLYSEESRENYRAFVFLDDWNAGVLRGVLEVILKEKFRNRQLQPGR